MLNLADVGDFLWVNNFNILGKTWSLAKKIMGRAKKMNKNSHF